MGTVFITNVADPDSEERDRLTAALTAAKPNHGFTADYLSSCPIEMLRGLVAFAGAGPIANAAGVPQQGLPLPKYTPRPVTPDKPAPAARPAAPVANAAPQQGLRLPVYKPRPPAGDNP